MEWIIIILILLLIPSVFFATRFFCLKTNIKSTLEEMKELIENPEANRILKSACPDHDYEGFLKVMNEYLLSNQNQRIKYLKRENEIRKEIENVSHDLRTPLTSILGYLELLDKNELSQEDREYIEVILRKSRALERLVGKFYELSRLEADEYSFSNQQIDIQKVISELLISSYSEFQQKEIQVSLDFKDCEILVMGDPDAFERIFMNLIHNVIKYARTNLWVSLKTDSRFVYITFENECKNISETDVSFLFDRFYKKDEARSNQSTGLGLTITKLLVEKMGGNITATINENGNLEFTLIFGLIENHNNWV